MSTRKKAKKASKPRATREQHEPAEIHPLTQAAADGLPGAEPFIGIITSDSGEGFGLGISRIREYRPAVRWFQCDKPIEKNGASFSWVVEQAELDKEGKTILRIVQRWLFKTKAEAESEYKKREADLFPKTPADSGNKYLPDPAHLPKHRASLPSRKQDLLDAQLKVLREQYPDTHAALESLKTADAEKRAEKLEDAFRAYLVDVARLRKDKAFLLQKDGRFFNRIPFDLVTRLAKSMGAISPFDEVDCELANNWESAGYSEMKPAEYTKAINAKLKTNISDGAMKQRATIKLGLTSKRQLGRPGNDGLLGRNC